MKITDSFKIYNTVYHNGSYLLLLGRKKCHIFNIVYELFFSF